MKKLSTLAFAIALCGTVYAAPEKNGLKTAEVTVTVNDVRIWDPSNGQLKPAHVKDSISGKAAVNTGIQSRAELLFNDKTLARIGANSTFSFEEGTRNMDLKKGTMLLQVPKGAGGATVRTAAVTAAITGTTVMIEHQPGQHAKVIVLEGTLRLYLNNQMGESILIKPGQMIFMDPNSNKIPEPVDVDLKALVGTSGLVNGMGGEGSSGGGGEANLNMDILVEQINTQANAFADGTLSDTNIFIIGEGGDVILADGELLAAIQQAVEAGTTTSKYSLPTLIPSDTGLATIDASTQIQTDPTISKNGVQRSGGYYDSNYEGKASPSQYLFGQTSTFDTASGFDENSENQVKNDDHAVFKFDSDVNINGQPSIDQSNGGAPNVALVAAKGANGESRNVTVGASTILDMDAGLALIAENGNVDLNNTNTINMNGYNFFAYARGTNHYVEVNSEINAGGGDVELKGELDVYLNDSITDANRFDVKAGEDFLHSSGTIQASYVDIDVGLINTASGFADINEVDTSTVSSFNVSSPNAINFNATADYNFLDGTTGNIIAGGAIDANSDFTGLTYIEAGGNVDASGDFGAGSIYIKNGANLSTSGSNGLMSEQVICTGTTTIGGSGGLAVRDFNTNITQMNGQPISSIPITSSSVINVNGGGGIRPHSESTSETEHNLYAYTINSTTGGIVGFDHDTGGSGYRLNLRTATPASFSTSDLSSGDINLRGGSGSSDSGGRFSLTTAGELVNNAKTIDVRTAGNGAGGLIYLKSTATSGNGIQVSSSSQLYAMTQAVPSSGSLIQLDSKQGAGIAITGSSSQNLYINASQTTAGNLNKILMDTLHTSGSGGGDITISTSDSAYKIQLISDIIRLRAGNNLNLQNTTLTANEIRLIAGNLITFYTGVTLQGTSGAAPVVYMSAPNITFDSPVAIPAAGATINYYTTGTAPDAGDFTGGTPTLNSLTSAPAFNP